MNEPQALVLITCAWCRRRRSAECNWIFVRAQHAIVPVCWHRWNLSEGDGLGAIANRYEEAS